MVEVNYQTVEIEKSSNDKRQYKYLKLPNNLECIIVKDTTESMCGACLNITIGSAHEKIEGLAHFLEHMVFQGSKKYPDSNDFMNNINKNGGKTNAYTSDTDTNYHFTISSERFLEALDKFAQFFIDPLLKQEFVDKEINAVDAEAKKNLLDDSWIQLEIYKTIMYENHPINHFTCGDLETLKVNNIYEELKKFHDKYYVAQNMSLVLFINNEVNEEEILKEVINNFGNIKNNNEVVSRSHGKIFKPNEISFYVPQKDENYLTVLLELPRIKSVKDDPLPLLIYILGSEVDDSLYTLLLDNGLCTRLSVSDYVSFDDYVIVTIELILTDDGLKFNEFVYNLILKYIEFVIEKIKNKDEYIGKIYKELNQSNLNAYTYWEKDDIFETIIGLSNTLKEDIPREHLLSYEIHNSSYETICEIVKQHYNNYTYNVILGSKEIKSICTKYFPRYKICYKTDKFERKDPIIDENNNFRLGGVNQSTGVNFTLPKLNHYLCYNLKIDTTIQAMPYPIDMNSIDYNTDIQKVPYISYYYGDKSYNTPSVDIRISIKLNNILNDVETYIGMLLYLNSAYGDINEERDMARLAGYTFLVKLDYDMLYILIGGYTEKITKVIDLLQKIFIQDFKKRSFKTAKYELVKLLKNFKKNSPITQADVLFESLIFKKFFHPDDQYVVAKDMTLEKCREIFKNNFNNCRVRMLTVGNVSLQNTYELHNQIYKNLNIHEQAEIQKEDPIKRGTELTKKIIKSPNKFETNSIGLVIYDAVRYRKHYTKAWKSMVLFCRLYNTLLANKFFNELRTKKQMGYIVKMKLNVVNYNCDTNIFIQFMIQSPKYKTQGILDEITNFIKTQNKYIFHEMKEEDFEIAKKAERAKLRNNFNTLAELGGYFMSAIFDESYKFDFRESLLDKLNRFDFNKFKSKLKDYVIENNACYAFGIDGASDGMLKKISEIS